MSFRIVFVETSPKPYLSYPIHEIFEKNSPYNVQKICAPTTLKGLLMFYPEGRVGIKHFANDGNPPEKCDMTVICHTGTSKDLRNTLKVYDKVENVYCFIVDIPPLSNKFKKAAIDIVKAATDLPNEVKEYEPELGIFTIQFNNNPNWTIKYSCDVSSDSEGEDEDLPNSGVYFFQTGNDPSHKTLRQALRVLKIWETMSIIGTIPVFMPPTTIEDLEKDPAVLEQHLRRHLSKR